MQAQLTTAQRERDEAVKDSRRLPGGWMRREPDNRSA
jgi:hypothetical protein